jgi:hypothetical protein
MNIEGIKVNGRYVATNENPLVLCSYGETAAEAFKQMYKLLKENEDDYVYRSVSAVNSYFNQEDNTHYVTAYI